LAGLDKSYAAIEISSARAYDVIDVNNNLLWLNFMSLVVRFETNVVIT